VTAGRIGIVTGSRMMIFQKPDHGHDFPDSAGLQR
jgi:hypothetical protein